MAPDFPVRIPVDDKGICFLIHKGIYEMQKIISWDFHEEDIPKLIVLGSLYERKDLIEQQTLLLKNMEELTVFQECCLEFILTDQTPMTKCYKDLLTMIQNELPEIDGLEDVDRLLLDSTPPWESLFGDYKIP